MSIFANESSLHSNFFQTWKLTEIFCKAQLKGHFKQKSKMSETSWNLSCFVVAGISKTNTALPDNNIFGREFGNIVYIDGTLCGTIGGFFDIFKYQSCPGCTCKVDDTMKDCSQCKKTLHEKVSTFKYELIMNMDNDELLFITGWMPSLASVIKLPSPLPDAEEIEELLNSAFDQKPVEIEFTTRNKDKKNMEKLIHKVIVKNWTLKWPSAEWFWLLLLPMLT